MSHFGLLCPPTEGHINPMATLGRALRKRGHKVTMFLPPELRERMLRERLDYWPIGDIHASRNEVSAAVKELGHLTGLQALRFTIRCAVRLAENMFRYAPAALTKAKVDLAIVDQNEPAGATVAEHLKLPFVSFAALPLNRESAIPPPFVPWRYRDSRLARIRNQTGYAIADMLLSPLTGALNRQRQEWQLPQLTSPNDSFSRYAQLCMLPKSLDFPRQQLPGCFHYLGPFIDEERASVSFPWELVDDRKPLVYASFGTILNRRQELFRTVAEACAGLDVQLVLSGGGGEISSEGLPGSPIAVRYAPQLELLNRASLVITHAGLNTVLEALDSGLPMVAIPLTNDQPAIGARILEAGVGEVIPLKQLSAPALRTSVAKVLTVESYVRHAQELRQQIRSAGGVQRAADIVEHLCSVHARTNATGNPVASAATNR